MYSTAMDKVKELEQQLKEAKAKADDARRKAAEASHKAEDAEEEANSRLSAAEKAVRSCLLCLDRLLPGVKCNGVTHRGCCRSSRVIACSD